MGLFVLDLEKPPTRKSSVKAAIANLELYLQELDGCNNNHYEHLLIFAENYIEKARKNDGLSDYDNLTRDDII